MSSGGSQRYKAGECNIGDEERRRRHRWAIITTLVGVSYLLAIIVSDAPEFLTAGVFVPATLAIEWMLEGRRSFCVRLAFAGQFSFEGQQGTIPADNHQADVRTAAMITAVAIVGGGAISILAYLFITVQ